MKNNRKALNWLKKFNVIVDKSTEQAILSGMITVTDVLKEYGENCCDWIVIHTGLPNEYTREEKEFYDKYIHSVLEIGKDRGVIIDYVEDEDTITIQVKHKDLWNEFDCSMGLIDEWYSRYLSWNRI